MISRRGFLASASSLTISQSQVQHGKMFGNAESYERFMGRWSRIAAPLLLDFADVPDTGRVLDVGCGTGRMASTITQRKPGVQVIGIDPSKEYIAYASRVGPFPDRTSFEIGDAQALRFSDGEFVAALSLLVFNFIPDPARALREVRRVTKHGGRISAAVWDYGDGMRMLRVFWDAATSLDPKADKLDEKHMPLCRAGELSQLWKRVGLEDVRQQPLTIQTKFESFADYWDTFLLGQGPAGAYVGALQSDRVQALREEVKRRLSISEERRAFTIPARLWAVRGSVPLS
jgi:ubiquinone/menaquinone biosynthesis C-methylase UbiE